MDSGRNAELRAGSFNVLDGGTERSPGREIEGEGDCREDALVIDGKGGVRVFVVGEGTERDKLPGLRGNVNRLERVRTWLEFGGDFHHDVILVQALINIGDLPLAEGVAQRVVNVHHSNTETGGGVSIDDDGAFEAVHLLVRIDVAELRNFSQALLKNRRPMREIGEIISLERVLILSPAKTATDAEVLNGLQVQSSAGNSGSLGADPRDDLIDAELALAERLELAENAGGAAAAAPAGK